MLCDVHEATSTRLVELFLLLFEDGVKLASVVAIHFVCKLFHLPSVVHRCRVVVETPHACIKKSSAVSIVRLLVKLEATCVFQVLFEFGREAAADLTYRCNLLLLFYLFVFLILVFAGHVLPREGAAGEVHQHVADLLHVVAAGLLVTQMGGHACVPGGSCEALTFLKRNVPAILAHILATQSESDQVDGVFRFFVVVLMANAKVLWLDIAMKDLHLVDLLYSADHLLAQQATCLDVKFLLALLEEILKTWAQLVHYHDVESLGWVRTDVVQLRAEGLAFHLVH